MNRSPAPAFFSFQPLKLSFEFLSRILRDFSYPSESFCFEKDLMIFPVANNAENLRELSLEHKLRTQVQAHLLTLSTEPMFMDNAQNSKNLKNFNSEVG